MSHTKLFFLLVWLLAMPAQAAPPAAASVQTLAEFPAQDTGDLRFILTPAALPGTARAWLKAEHISLFYSPPAKEIERLSGTPYPTLSYRNCEKPRSYNAGWDFHFQLLPCFGTGRIEIVNREASLYDVQAHRILLDAKGRIAIDVEAQHGGYKLSDIRFTASLCRDESCSEVTAWDIYQYGYNCDELQAGSTQVRGNVAERTHTVTFLHDSKASPQCAFHSARQSPDREKLRQRIAVQPATTQLDRLRVDDHAITTPLLPTKAGGWLTNPATEPNGLSGGPDHGSVSGREIGIQNDLRYLIFSSCQNDLCEISVRRYPNLQHVIEGYALASPESWKDAGCWSPPLVGLRGDGRFYDAHHSIATYFKGELRSFKPNLRANDATSPEAQVVYFSGGKPVASLRKDGHWWNRLVENEWPELMPARTPRELKEYQCYAQVGQALWNRFGEASLAAAKKRDDAEQASRK